MTTVFWNGIFCPADQVKISIQDRGFLFGDGVFITVRIDHGHPQFLTEHLKNFEAQCKEIGITPPLINPKSIQELILRNQATQGVWRLKIIATGGQEEKLNLTAERKGETLMTLKPYEGPFFTPLSLCVFPFPLSSPLSKIKALAYLDRLYIKEFALQNNADDALVKNGQGFILESSMANIFWKIDHKIFIPDPCLPYYFGVTLESVIHAVSQCPFDLCYVKATEIPPLSQPFICNSMIGICPVIAIANETFSRDLHFEKMLKDVIRRMNL